MSRRIITPDRLLPEKGIGFTPAWLRNLEKRGQFPGRIQLVPGGRKIGWYEDEIDQWIEQRERVRPTVAEGGGE